jgi:hypothetical protein
MGTTETRIVQAETVDRGGRELRAVAKETGLMALATMSPDEFGRRLELLKLGQERVRLIQAELMVKDEDYGVIPGTKKPALLKPGAEKLCKVYDLVPVYTIEFLQGDGDVTPMLTCRMTCTMHQGDADGPVVGFGVGSANTHEKKHRYRGAQRACPSCGCEGTIARSSFERDGDKGWWCHNKRGGCGTNFHSTDPAITEQERGQVQNPDPFDAENTIFKMAKKRAKIDATLDATATSGLFTQDVEDDPPPPDSGASGGGRTPATGAENGSGAPPAAPRQAQPQAAPAQPRQAAPAQPAKNGGGKAAEPGKLPPWNGPCPRCGVSRCVIVSRQKAGTYHCWKKSNPPGCGLDFTPADAEMHAGAARHREQIGFTDDGPAHHVGGNDNRPGPGDGFQVTDDDVPY